jgi:hypothetical protein
MKCSLVPATMTDDSARKDLTGSSVVESWYTYLLEVIDWMLLLDIFKK